MSQFWKENYIRATYKLVMRFCDHTYDMTIKQTEFWIKWSLRSSEIKLKDHLNIIWFISARSWNMYMYVHIAMYVYI
jgi:hypothetical protein